MSESFELRTTPGYDRLLKKIVRRDPSFLEVHLESLSILLTDPYNRTRAHDIKKLTNVKSGEGEFRLRLGHWRFRYSIFDHVVVLYYCGLRREDTY